MRGVWFWTAGQRIDPSRESTFVWRTHTTLSEMTYTNWYPREPSYGGQTEACVNIWSGHSYKWNDYPCSRAICSVCELDMA